MGRIRKTARSIFSFGGYYGLSPIAKESDQARLLREQNELITEQNRLLRPPEPRKPSPLAACAECGVQVRHALGRAWEPDGAEHRCG